MSATLVHVRRKCAFKDRQRQTGREERLPIKQHRARWRGKKKGSARIKKKQQTKTESRRSETGIRNWSRSKTGREHVS